MNELTPQRSNQALISTRCAVSLRWLAYELADPRYPQTTQRSRILTHGTEQEVRQSLTALSERFRPATQAEIAGQLARLSVQYWQPNQTEEMDDLKWADYCTALSPITNEELANACRAWLRSPNAFFPKPGQLLELVKGDISESNRHRAGLQKVREALDTPDPEPAKEESFISPERMREFLAARGKREETENLVALKEEILNRPPIQPTPIPMTPENRDRLLRSAKQALRNKFGEAADRYIAELPIHHGRPEQ